MEKKKYLALFKSFEKASLESFVDTVLQGISDEHRKMLKLYNVSFTYEPCISSGILRLQAIFELAPTELHKCIDVVVELRLSGDIQERYYVLASYEDQRFKSSLQECIDYYDKDRGSKDKADCLPRFKLPRLKILNEEVPYYGDADDDILKMRKIRKTLEEHGVNIEVDMPFFSNSSVAEFRIIPAPGVRLSRIKALSSEFTNELGVSGIRLRMDLRSHYVALEIPKGNHHVLPVRSLFSSKAFRWTWAELPLAIGMTTGHEERIIDLADAPHILVAGTSKQESSDFLHAMVASLLFKKHPSELRLVFVDTESAGFCEYQRLNKHYLARLANDPGTIASTADEAASVLDGLCKEMDNRYGIMLSSAVRNIHDYNEITETRMPYIVCFIGELADLTDTLKVSKTTSRKITQSIVSLAKRGRAAGIHLVMATSRPSRNVITASIKANVQTRIAFRTNSLEDSKTIIDMPGAEVLTGAGDLLLNREMITERIQGGYISSEEVTAIVDFISSQKGFNAPYDLLQQL